MLRSVAVLALAALAGCGQPSEAELLASAQTFLGKRDTRAALVQAKTALQANPESGPARLLLGRVLVAARDGEAALVELRKARDLGQPDTAVVPLEAEAMLLVRQPAELLARLGDRTLGDPAADAALQTTLATALMSQKQIEPATVALSKALNQVPDYAPALLAQARIDADAGRVAQARAQVEKVIARTPDDDRAWVLKGDLYLHATPSDADAALQAYRQAIALWPASTQAHAGVMFVHMGRNDIKAAHEQLAVMRRDLAGDPLTRFFGAQIALIDGDVKAAREGIQPLLKQFGDDFKVLTLAGAIELQARSPNTAENHLKQALQIAPGHPYATRLLAQAYVGGGQTAKALELLEPLVTRSDADAQTLSLAAEASLYSGDVDRAVTLFTRAAALDPKNTKARTAVALSQLAKGRPDDAMVGLATIAASSSDDFADLALISLRISRAEYPLAIEAIDALEKKRPDSAIAAHMRGRVHLAQAEPDAAKKWFELALQRSPGFYAAVVALVGIDVTAGNDAGAEAQLQRYLKPEVDNAMARAWLIEIRARRGAKQEELATLVDDMVRRHPELPAARLLQVNHFLANRDKKTALEVAQQAAAAFPNSPDIQDALGRAQLGNGDGNQAIATFRRLTIAYPHLPLPHVHLADAYVASQQPQAAIRSLRRAVELLPNDPSAQRGLVTLLVSSGNDNEAIQRARAMQKQAGNRLVGHLLEGDIDARARRWDAAIAAYQRGIEVQPAPELAIALHRTLAAAGREDDRRKFAARWSAEHPRDNGFAFALGEHFARLQQWPAAEAEFRRALALQPDQAAAMNNLAYALMVQGKPEALELAERANALKPDRPDLLDTLAQVQSAQAQHAKALETVRRALSLSGDSPVYRITLARLLGASGDRAAARKELEAISLLQDPRIDKARVSQLMSQMRD